MPKYLALTIGPITGTTAKARNTRGLWAASYLFSYLMRKLIEALDKNPTDYVMPLVADERLAKPYGGAGLYPDRLIVKINDDENAAQLLQMAAETVLTDLCEQPAIQKILKNGTGLALKAYLTQYLLLAGIEVELPESANVIQRCSNLLAQLELQAPLPHDEQSDWLSLLLKRANELDWTKEAFAEGEERRFPSLIEIATSEFATGEFAEKYEPIRKSWLKESRQDAADETNQDLLEMIANKGIGPLLQYHKYIAIVKADGDNMGKTLQALYEHNRPEQVPALDKALLNFNIDAIAQIRKFGGRAVYLGGDDLVFFAPICYQSESVFGLINRLSSRYDAFLSEALPDIAQRPTLSFGVSITYHKYPLFEALHDAEAMLNKAKEHPDRKNAVAFRLLKHSGQFIEAKIYKDSITYSQHFLSLVDGQSLQKEQIKSLAQAPSTADGLLITQRFLTSVLHGLRENRSLLELALQRASDTSETANMQAVTNFFDNTYNERIHDQQRPFINSVRDFLKQAFDDSSNQPDFDTRFREAIYLTFGTLRFLKFLTQPLSNTDDDD